MNLRISCCGSGSGAASAVFCISENTSERENSNTVWASPCFLIRINCLLGLCLLMWTVWKNYVRYHIETGNRWCLTGSAGEETALPALASGGTTRTAATCATCVFCSPRPGEIAACLGIAAHHAEDVLISLQRLSHDNEGIIWPRVQWIVLRSCYDNSFWISEPLPLMFTQSLPSFGAWTTVPV